MDVSICRYNPPMTLGAPLYGYHSPYFVHELNASDLFRIPARVYLNAGRGFVRSKKDFFGKSIRIQLKLSVAISYHRRV